MENDADAPPEGSSDRSFGLVFTAFFAVVATLPLWEGGALRNWALIVAGLFLAASLGAPRLLAPLNRLWMKAGRLLGRITSPIALGIVFFGAVMPTGLLMRLFGKDPLRLRADPQARSYWIGRAPPGPAPESLKNQF